MSHIESLRQQYENNLEFRLRINQPTHGRPIQRGTRFIAKELLGSFLKNKTLKITRNHVIDVSHAIVAVAHCDHVLLDAHWATQTDQARKRFSDGGFDFPMAKVFSEKKNGIESFLRKIESGGV